MLVIFKYFSIILLQLFLTHMSFAQGPAPEARQPTFREIRSKQIESLMQNCPVDVTKYCKDEYESGLSPMPCLKNNRENLSELCEKNVDVLKVSSFPFVEFSRDCKTELEILCKGVETGEGRKLACLEAAKDKITQSCRSSFSKAKNQIALDRKRTLLEPGKNK
jgi:hypothetical protein